METERPANASRRRQSLQEVTDDFQAPQTIRLLRREDIVRRRHRAFGDDSSSRRSRRRVLEHTAEERPQISFRSHAAGCRLQRDPRVVERTLQTGAVEKMPMTHRNNGREAAKCDAVGPGG